LGRQEDYEAKRSFLYHITFHLLCHIFHLSLSEAPLPAMTN
jgi:hypothetical protein